MRKISILVSIFFSLVADGQNVFKGRLYSVVDSTQIPHFSIRVENKSIVTTDSTGFFSVTSRKRKIRLATIFGVHGFDTTIFYKDSIKLYSIKYYDSTLAKYDIQLGSIRLFCGVAFAPMAPTQQDKAFEIKYSVHYYIVGDFLPSSVAQMTSYNLVVADYLDRKYGKGWRFELRHDVLGMMQNKAGSQQPVLRKQASGLEL